MYYDLLMIRHGATEGNLKKRYVGRTDEPLCEEGIYRLQKLAQKLRLQEVLLPRETLAARGIVWILSPMRRCVETAEILKDAGIFPEVRVPGIFPEVRVPGIIPEVRVPGIFPEARVPDIFPTVHVPGSDGAGAASEPLQNRPEQTGLALNEPPLTDAERTKPVLTDPVLTKAEGTKPVLTYPVLTKAERMKSALSGQVLADTESPKPTLPGQILVDPDLRECDFGQWENRSYRDLKDDPAYQAWIDSQGTLPFPGGEDPEAFRKRCCAAFERCIARCRREGIDGTERAEETEKAEGTERAEETEKAEGTERADGTDRTKGTGGAEESERTDGPEEPKTPLLILAAHGGTIMSILSKYGLDETGKKRDYFDWQLGCAQAYVCRMETGSSGQIRKILVKNRLETEE